MHRGRGGGSRVPHERGATPMPGLPRDDTRGTGSPRHASAPADATRGQLAQTRAAALHCSVVPPPDVPSHLTLRHANPVRGTQVPSTVGTHLHFGPDVSSLIHTKEG
jgi:hypothetical protein